MAVASTANLALLGLRTTVPRGPTSLGCRPNGFGPGRAGPQVSSPRDAPRPSSGAVRFRLRSPVSEWLRGQPIADGTSGAVVPTTYFSLLIGGLRLSQSEP